MPQLDHCGIGEEGELKSVKFLPEVLNVQGMHRFSSGTYYGQTTGQSVFGVRTATQTHLMVLPRWLTFESVSKQNKGYT